LTRSAWLASVPALTAGELKPWMSLGSQQSRGSMGQGRALTAKGRAARATATN